MITMPNSTNQAELFRRILERQHASITPEVAHFFLQLDFPEQDRQRLDELAAKSRQGNLSSVEEADLDEYRRLCRLVELLKLKARKVLATAS
jgi:hypothetical protein